MYAAFYQYNKRYVSKIIKGSALNKTLLNKILVYTFFNGVGGIAVTIRTNGTTLIINKFLGPEFSAFHGLANSIASIGSQINSSIINVMKPRIISRFREDGINLRSGIGSLLIVSNLIVMIFAIFVTQSARIIRILVIQSNII